MAYPSGATIYYVSTTGNDNNSGTSWGTAFAYLQKAVTAAGNGDTIFIAAGDYIQTEITGFTKNLNIYGSFEGWENSPAQRTFAPGDTTILDGNGNPQNITANPAGTVLFISGNKSKVLLNGLKIANGVNYDNQNAFGTGGGVFMDGDSVWIDRCTLFNNGSYNGSAIGQPGGYLVLTRSVIANNFHSGSLVVTQGSTVVNECQFNNNEAGGIDFQGQNLAVTNTQIVFNRGHFQKGAINVETGKAIVANNTFYMDSVYPLGTNGSVLQIHPNCTVTFQNNIVWACLTTVISNQGTLNETYNIGQVNTTITGSMGFADSTQPFNGGLALTAVSPAVNDGDSAGVSAYLGDSDLANNFRFQGCRVDQGAFESAVSGMIQMRAQPVGDTICPGANALFAVSATGDSPVFQWQSQSGATWSNVPGATDTFLTTTATSTYRCIITGTGQCIASDTSAVVGLTMESLPIITSQPVNDTVCVGGNALYSVGVSGTHPLFQWQTGSGAIVGMGDSLILSPVDSDGVYRCIVSDSLGCGKSDTSITALLKVNSGPGPFSLGKDTTLCRGDSLELAVQPLDSGADYAWQDGSDHPYFEVVSAGTYTVQVHNSCGSLDGSIAVAYQACACAFYIPNAFTPNGDGRNDLFKPQYQCLFNHYLMKVFNRWGQVVFLSQEADNGWDGTVRGIAQPVGAYAWEISYEDIVGGHIVVRQGTVVLMR
jgi:gliding motility-associated-like protein